MPVWMRPWLVPLAVAVVVVLVAVSSTVAWITATVILLICAAGLVVARLQYLKKNPPDPELVHKPFWKF